MLYSLSRLVFDRFAAVNSNIHSILQSVTKQLLYRVGQKTCHFTFCPYLCQLL